MRPTFAIAPGFHFGGGWSDRLLVAEGENWRAAREDEIAGLVVQAPGASGAALLFVTPAHLRAKFWDMLSEQAEEGTGDFLVFADDTRQFLAFKELPPPADAVFELVVQDEDGAVDTAGLWALANFGDDPLVLDWPGVRLRLGAGEGCRIDAGFPPGVVPPADEQNVMVVIRTGEAAQQSLLED
jgi:hypothetical protein